jgi:hypothetical protein
MKEPARPSPINAALRVKDMAVDLASDLAEGYRKSTRHARLRTAVVGVWLFLSAATIWMAFSSGGTNSLGATALMTEGLMGKGLLVRNDSESMWTDVILTLDGKWQWQTPTIREGEKPTVLLERFTHDGAPAPADLKPRTLTIECREGSATLPLSPPGSP